ncbi:divisome protein SepX/GlpR [Streptomyces capparidis]
MSSSGLIYAVIVGAWAAYLVPMWLRRQDELNEARPTERFSTAIRLLSGRAAMERRYAKAATESGHAQDPEEPHDPAPAEPEPAPAPSVDVRDLAVPVRPRQQQQQQQPPPPGHGTRRARVLARRRRTTVVLFLTFTAGTVAAAVGGWKLLWLPAVPGVLLTAYIAHLRRQERRRFEVKLDQHRAAEAAHRLRETRPPRPAAAPPAAAPPAPEPPAAPEPEEAVRRAVVEETDHAEWVDGMRRRPADQDGWEPVPVPLPTYVTAPVAPRNTTGVDLNAPGTWSSARLPKDQDPTTPRSRERGRTPLFDQYADQDRPRAANE